MPKLVTDGLTTEEDAQLQALLQKWADAGGGQFADATFTWLAYALPQPCVETVVLRQRDGKIEVLLIPRPEGDPIWPNMLHSPGQAIRRADYSRPDKTPIKGPFERVQKNEIKTNFAFVPRFVGTDICMTARGPEVALCYLAQISPNATLPENAIWIDTNDLASESKFIQHQLPRVKMAREEFERILVNIRS